MTKRQVARTVMACGATSNDATTYCTDDRGADDSLGARMRGQQNEKTTEALSSRP